MRTRCVLPLAILLLALDVWPAGAETANTRDACNQWLETGIQPKGITRSDCNFARDKPQGSILNGGTSDATRIWREQDDHQTRFVIDTGSEQKQPPRQL